MVTEGVGGRGRQGGRVPGREREGGRGREGFKRLAIDTSSCSHPYRAHISTCGPCHAVTTKKLTDLLCGSVI